MSESCLKNKVGLRTMILDNVSTLGENLFIFDASGLLDCSGDGMMTCNKFRVARLPWFKLFKQGQSDQDYLQVQLNSFIRKTKPLENPTIISYFVGKFTFEKNPF